MGYFECPIDISAKNQGYLRAQIEIDHGVNDAIVVRYRPSLGGRMVRMFRRIDGRRAMPELD